MVSAANQGIGMVKVPVRSRPVANTENLLQLLAGQDNTHCGHPISYSVNVQVRSGLLGVAINYVPDYRERSWFWGGFKNCCGKFVYKSYTTSVSPNGVQVFLY